MKRTDSNSRAKYFACHVKLLKCINSCNTEEQLLACVKLRFSYYKPFTKLGLLDIDDKVVNAIKTKATELKVDHRYYI